jgi:hypothetical protein
MSIDIETQKLLIDIAGNTIQILAIFLGIWVAAYQIRKGYENNLNLQKENIKNEHFSKLHGEIKKL